MWPAGPWNLLWGLLALLILIAILQRLGVL